MIGWIHIHFQKVLIVQIVCLTLVGEETLWYELLRSIVVDCSGLQVQFKLQYSRIHITRERLFLVWKSFHFDENSETIDMYVK